MAELTTPKTNKRRFAIDIKRFDWKLNNIAAWIVTVLVGIVTVLVGLTTFGLLIYAVVGSIILSIKNFWQHLDGGWPLLTAFLTVTVVVVFFRAHYRKHGVKFDWGLSNVLGMAVAILFLTLFGLSVPEMLHVVFEVLNRLWRSFLDPKEWPMTTVVIGSVVFYFLIWWLVYYAAHAKFEAPNRFADYLLAWGGKFFLPHVHKVVVAVYVVGVIGFLMILAALVVSLSHVWHERSELLENPPWPKLAFLAVFIGLLGLVHWLTRERL